MGSCPLTILRSGRVGKQTKKNNRMNRLLFVVLAGAFLVVPSNCHSLHRRQADADADTDAPAEDTAAEDAGEGSGVSEGLSGVINFAIDTVADSADVVFNAIADGGDLVLDTVENTFNYLVGIADNKLELVKKVVGGEGGDEESEDAAEEETAEADAQSEK